MFNLDMLKSLAWLALVWWLIASLVIINEKLKTNTPDTDKTFLGFMTVITIPYLFGTVTIGLMSIGLMSILMAFLSVLGLRDLVKSSVGYIKDRKQKPLEKTLT